jgi:hypothetical protein
VREAVAALADAGHAADVDIGGAHFKISWSQTAGHDLLVVSKPPFDHRAYANCPRHVAAASPAGRAPAMRPALKPSFARSAAGSRYGLEVRLAAGLRCRCGRELKAYEFEVDRLRIRAICHRCHQDVVTIER